MYKNLRNPAFWPYVSKMTISINIWKPDNSTVLANFEICLREIQCRNKKNFLGHFPENVENLSRFCFNFGKTNSIVVFVRPNFMAKKIEKTGHMIHILLFH